MNGLKRHFPGFVDVDESERVRVEFSSLDELKDIPWVKSWQEAPRFSNFAQSGIYLMAILNGGKEWWVVGFLDHPVDGLPEWHAPKAQH